MVHHNLLSLVYTKLMVFDQVALLSTTSRLYSAIAPEKKPYFHSIDEIVKILNQICGYYSLAKGFMENIKYPGYVETYNSIIEDIEEVNFADFVEDENNVKIEKSMVDLGNNNILNLFKKLHTLNKLAKTMIPLKKIILKDSYLNDWYNNREETQIKSYMERNHSVTIRKPREDEKSPPAITISDVLRAAAILQETPERSFIYFAPLSDENSNEVTLIGTFEYW